MRLVMFGTGPFAAPTFRALFDTSHDVVALVTQPPRVVRGKVVAAASPLRDEAVQRGTPILDPEDVNTAAAQAQLAEYRADLFVVADYGQILSLETLALAPRGAINLHGSLLPKFRGAAPINWALYRGDKETGVSTIHMTPRVDAGPVLAQARTPIDADENAVELETRLAAIGAPLVLETIAAIESGTAAALPQDLALATKARRLRKTDGAIDWSRPALAIKNQVRALQPWPRAYTDWLRTSGEPMRLIIGRVDVRDDARSAVPGTVIAADKHELVIAAGEGAVSLLEVQPAGRQMMPVADFLRGHPLRPGEKLGIMPESAP
ncbi:MAG TPA: methionyl-tRNA formyltransferase [Pirellulales bacterium]